MANLLAALGFRPGQRPQPLRQVERLSSEFGSGIVSCHVAYLLVYVVSVELDHDCCHCFFPDPLTVSSFVGRISKTMASRRKPEDVALALFERGAPKARCFRPMCFLTV